MKLKKRLVAAKIKIVFSVLAALVSTVQIQAQTTDAELEHLVKAVTTDSQKGAIFNYSYQMKVSFVQHKMGGRKFTKLYEAFLPSHFSGQQHFSHPLVLLEDSEREIPFSEIILSRQAAVRQIENAESTPENAVSETDKSTEDGGYWTIGYSAKSQRININILELIKNSRLNDLRREQINGTNLILLNFTPNPNAVFEKSLAYLSKLEGQIWIDERSKRIVRIEGFAPGEFVGLKRKSVEERQKQAVFLFSQIKVAEGCWFPQIVRLNFSKHPEISQPFQSAELNFTFTNYKKPLVDVSYKSVESLNH